MLGSGKLWGVGAMRRVFAAGALALAGVGFAAPAFAVNLACGDAIRVTPGDTLLQVASYCRTTVPALLAANPTISHPNTIRVGQLIYMPGRNAGLPVQAAPMAQAAVPPPPRSFGSDLFSRCGATVQVRPSDTFGTIARDCGISTAQLRAANPQLRDPNLIFVGMTLRVPSSLAPQVSRPVPAPVPVPVPVAQNLRIIGTITGEGITCQAVRGDDGALYTIAGIATRPLRPGDRVEITGTRASSTICQQGTAISASQILLLDTGQRPGLDVTGTITREGVTCTALRGDDGRLYTLAGQTAGFQPGDRVRMTGDLAQTSFCQQGTTINLRSLRAAF